jgi:uncharacterized membrane protein YedE/YeeE
VFVEYQFLMIGGILITALLAGLYWLHLFKIETMSGFLIYVADSLEYLSSVTILLVKDWAVPDWSWDQCYCFISFGMAGLRVVCLSVSFVYFLRKYESGVMKGLSIVKLSDSQKTELIGWGCCWECFGGVRGKERQMVWIGIVSRSLNEREDEKCW